MHRLIPLALLLAGCSGGLQKRVAFPATAGISESNNDAIETTATTRSGAKPDGARMMAWSGRVLLEVSEVTQVFEKAIELVRKHNGFVDRTRHHKKYSIASIRVPSAEMRPLVKALRKLGKVADVSIRGENLYDRIIDVRIRLKNAEKLRDQYLAILARATTTKDALEAQRELSKVTLQIERFKTQLQHAEKRVKYANLQLAVKKPVRPGVVGWVFYGLYRGVKWLFVWD